MKKLALFYKKMEQAMIIDGDSYLKVQAKWLNISDEKLQNIIEESKKDHLVKIVSLLEKRIQPMIEQSPFSREINIQLREKIRIPLKNLWIHFDNNGDENANAFVIEFNKPSISKNGQNQRTLSTDKFNTSMKKANLPYVMKREKALYTIEKITLQN